MSTGIISIGWSTSMDIVVGVDLRRRTDDGLRVWRMFLEAHTRLLRQLDVELQATHSLPVDWFNVLAHLQQTGGSQTMGQLAEAMLISPSNCSRLVDRLVGEGLVERKTDETDGRVKHAVITEAGLDILRAAAPTHSAAIERHFTRFLADDTTGVTTLFRGVLESLDAPQVARVAEPATPGTLSH